MVKKRVEVSKEDQWNIGSMYPSLEKWRKEFESTVPKATPKWPKLASYRGTLGKEAKSLKEFLDFSFDLDQKLARLYTYAHLKHDEDIAESSAKAAYIEILSALNAFHEEMSWFEPELLALSQETIQSYLKDPSLEKYRFHLEKIFRLKPHTLSSEQELLLAMSGKALSATQKAFSAISDADFKFPLVSDSSGQEHELSHAKYALHLRSKDRELRKNAFKKYHGKYETYQNTLAELLSGQIEAHVFQAKARGFKSSLEAALFPHNIDVDVYRMLIETVHKGVDALHRYMEIRSHILKLETLHIYDFQVPLVPSFDMQIPYHEAEDLVIESTAPLGEEYQETLRKGLKNDRWVDRYENVNKRSGAYSSGCYDSAPYILMNYKEILRDLFTLAHEAGHSMHSYFSNKSQPYPYSRYSIFVAEVASTFNEELLMQTLLKRAKTNEEKIFLITQKIEDIRATLFRQAQFAEFEWLIHTLAENHTPMTPERLNEEYYRLNKLYYGEKVEHDPEIAIEWARIPHFYYNFYVYQYATGISAALALSQQVVAGGKKEQGDYLRFLKSGGSLYPLDVLATAGVDMRKSAPVERAIQQFRSLLDQLEKLVKIKK